VKTPTQQAVNLYINWVIYAVTGGLAEADSLMRRNSYAIYSVARYLQSTRPIEIKTLHRGVLLDAKEAASGFLQRTSQVTFVSFSEDVDVACWFADAKSEVSGYVVEVRPDVKGYMVEYLPELTEVLAHHEWLKNFPVPGHGTINLGMFILQHPHPDLDAVQFAWNLGTQSEVIVVPFDTPLKLTPHAKANCSTTAELNAKLLHPAFMAMMSQ
jgi:hypothetical protein